MRQGAARWSESRRPHSHLPLGTTFIFRLEHAATVKLRFLRAGAGRIKGGRCVAPQLARVHARSCALGVGSFSVKGHAGVNTIRYLGRIPPLSPGRYTLTLTAIDKNGHVSPAATLQFTIAA